MSDPRARYSRVLRRMWNDEGFRALSAPTSNAQTLWLRLLTGPELTNVPGVIMAWEAGLAQALKWSLEGFRKAFAEIRTQGMAEADWEVGLVWVPKAVVHNAPASPNVVKSWLPTWDMVPECGLKSKVSRALMAKLTELGEPFAEAFSLAVKDFAKANSDIQEQDQDQEQDQEQDQDQDHEGGAESPGQTTLALVPRSAAESSRRLTIRSLVVRQVFEPWASARKRVHPKGPPSTLDPRRAAIIIARLNEGFDPEQLKLAAAGIWRSPFHRGENDKRTEYTGLHLALRDAEQIERFAELELKARPLTKARPAVASEAPSGTVAVAPEAAASPATEAG